MFIPFARFCAALETVLQRHATDGSCGDIIFEVGEAMRRMAVAMRGKVCGKPLKPGHVEVACKAIAMHSGWCDAARDACVAWVIIAKKNGLEQRCQENHCENGVGDQKGGIDQTR